MEVKSRLARKKKEQPAAPGSPAWMATFADLVTLLMCFFVLLYSMSSIDTAKLQAMAAGMKGEKSLIQSAETNSLLEMMGNGLVQMPDPVEQSETKKEDVIIDEEYKDMESEVNDMYTDFKAYIEAKKLGNKIELKKNPSNIEIIIKDNILYDKGKDNIRAEAIPILDSIADLISAKYQNSQIEITGHTDSDPINVPRFPDNWFLSSARAIVVGKYLMNEKNFSPLRISAVGRGEFNPIAPNDTEENKSKNRRVEIKIFSSFAETEE